MITDIEHRFGYHMPVSSFTVRRHEDVRKIALNVALLWDEVLPEGREKEIAIEKLEEALMWANAAIAREV
jgi:hypothetical protein